MTTNWKHWMCLGWLLLMPISGNAVTPMIAAGHEDSLFLNGDGTIWGAGHFPNSTSPVRVLELPNVVAVASGFWTDFALLADGTLWGSGSNAQGQLGDGTTQPQYQPQRVPGLSGIRAVAVSSQVLALKQDGTVWAWGQNNRGQLGDGTKTDRYLPVQVTGLTNITKIAASSDSSLALKADGTVWMWGTNCCWQLSSDFDPELNLLTPAQVHNLDQVVAISAGGGHHMALRADGTVWSWGLGQFGENGTGQLSVQPILPVQVPGLDHVIAIDANGQNLSLDLRSDGTVWAWGNNTMGRLGVSGISYSATPMQVPGLSDIVAISSGFNHILALRRDGTVLAWGWNGYAQLGDGTLQNHADPRPVLGPGGSGQLNLVQPPPASFNQTPHAQIDQSIASGTAPLAVLFTATNATDPDGTVTALNWKTSDGQQASGQSAAFVFAQPGTFTIDLLVVDNAGGSGWTRAGVVVAPAAASVSVTPKIGIGAESSIALANDGRILTWGFSGLLGLYDNRSLPTANSHPIANGLVGAIDVAIGSSRTAHVLLADGTVSSWGMNRAGEAGIGTEVDGVAHPQQLPNLPPVQALAAGLNFGLALTRDGRVFSWGGNAYGQLGLGDSNNRFQPAEVTGLSDVIAIGAGFAFSVALKSDGTVWAWGDNGAAQLGDGTRVSRNLPTQIPGLANITKIFVANAACYALTANGEVWVTGSPSLAIAGDPGPDSGPRHLAVFDGAVQIAGGSQHVIMLKSDGTVWTGGQQRSFALGFADGGDIVGLRQVPRITDAIWVAAGVSNSAVIRRDGTVLMWGLNDYGQIGDGTLAQRLMPVAVVNENADGFLDLIPSIDFELPPSVGVPFFVVASGSVADVTASVSTTTKFNAPDVGKSGSVFVTATVPPGSLVPAQSAMSTLGTSGVSTSGANRTNGATSSALTAADSFVLIQLTSAGWQPVVNGQLIAYASGVLGDQLSAQTILNNTDTTNLKGAQFCLGYGASADQMIAVGTMRVVASIPDPNATGAAAPSCIVAGPPVSYSVLMPQGWNLLGNSLNQTLSVASLYGDPNTVTTVWKWDPSSLGWQFYTPLMDAAALQSYAAAKGYGVLSTINPGEGYWVNAKAQPMLGTQSGASFILTSTGLVKGWNLVATGNDITPSQFNTNLKSSLPGTGVTTLWAWDNPSANWYFYAPSLETQGATALADYIRNKGYLDYNQRNKTLGNGTGFWVNRP